MQDNSKQSSGNQSGQSGQKPSLSWSQPAVPQTSTVKTVAPAPTPAKTTSANHAPVSAGNSNAVTYVSIFVVGVIVGALIGWGITSSNKGNTSTTATSTNMTASTTTSGSMQTGTSSGVDLTGSAMGASSGSITLASTEQAGFAVAVTKIAVSQPTWLVVYEDHNGTPGNAIGAGLFFAGSTSGTIQLLRATLPGTSYLVGQSLDDGDKIFSISSDKPVRDEKGNPLFTEFTAQ